MGSRCCSTRTPRCTRPGPLGRVCASSTWLQASSPSAIRVAGRRTGLRCEQMGDEGRRYVARQFSWQAHLDHLEAVYRDVLVAASRTDRKFQNVGHLSAIRA